MSRQERITPPSVGRAGRRRGLTLVELVVVLTVLVALAGLIVPLFGGIGADAPEQATRATLSQVAETIVGPGGYVEAMRFAADDSGDAVGYNTGLPWPPPDAVTAGVRTDHPQLAYLFEFDGDNADGSTTFPDYDAVNRIGWRAAWLDAGSATAYENNADGFEAAYGRDDDPAPRDGWGNPVVIQLPGLFSATDPPDPPTEDELFNARLVSAGPNEVIDTPRIVITDADDADNDDIVLYLNRTDPFPPED
ncbi:MAG: prepilin-type N-terminal cleavage/methylation domain-containing protein [Planctomycetota bacterium]